MKSSVFSKVSAGLLLASGFIAWVSTGCSEVETFSVNAPDGIGEKIDSIAAANASKQSSGDTTFLTVATSIVGAEDCSSGWWTVWSDDFAVPAGKTLHLEFINHTSGANNWNNWNVCVANMAGAKSTSDNSAYGEHFALRSDIYGWGGSLSTYDAGLLKSNYLDTDDSGAYLDDFDGDGDIWGDFRSQMEGAECHLEFDHATTGMLYFTGTSACDKYTYVETYEQDLGTVDDVYAFLICDGSYFEMKRAYLTSSTHLSVDDQVATSIVASDYPTSIEVGDSNYVGNAKFTVTYADGSSAQVDTSDVTFSIDEAYLTTPGTYTVVYSYSGTKLGNNSTSVNGYYNIEVTNRIVEIKASYTAYVIGGAKYVTLSPAAVNVTAVYANGSEASLSSDLYSVEFTGGKVVYPGTIGTTSGIATVTYSTASGESLTATCDLEIKASSLPAQTDPVGAEDFSNGWWSTFTQDWAVASGENQTVSMTLSSLQGGNWQSPCTILRKADFTEYAVVRMDNYGWGELGYGTAKLESNWNWDTFRTSLTGSTVCITVANNGDGTASVRYYVVYANGEEHYQYYDNISVDADDLQFALVTEESYLVFD